MLKKLQIIIAAIIFVCITATVSPAQIENNLVITPEKTNYEATSTHADVMDFINKIKSHPLVNYEVFAKSLSGKDVPLVILADPAVSTPEEAKASGKPVLYFQGNIHGGEVEGKESLMILMREILYGDKKHLLENQILLIGPIYNSDGNDKMGDNTRRSQEGSPKLAGSRPSGEGFDLNRDGIKIEALETKGLIKNVLIKWDAELLVDLHTTNGTWHGYPLTYAPNYLSANHPATSNYLFDEFLPAVVNNLKANADMDIFLYGYYSMRSGFPPKEWVTYNHHPRYIVNYMGMRNKMGILSEAFAHDRFYKRINSTYNFVLEIMEYTNSHAKEIMETNQRAEKETIENVKMNAGKIKKGVRFKKVPFDRAVTLKTYDYDSYTGDDGKIKYVRKGNIIEVPGVKNYQKFEATVEATLPRGYVIPAEFTDVIAKLKEHGIVVIKADKKFKVSGEEFVVESLENGRRKFEGHFMAEVKGKFKNSKKSFKSGVYIVDLEQPLANLAFYLLEPESDDGLTAWNFFDEYLKGNGVDKKKVTFPVFKYFTLDK